MSRAVATPAPVAVRWPFRAEHVMMALAAIALTVLVVLPLLSLLLASVSGEAARPSATSGRRCPGASTSRP